MLIPGVLTWCLRAKKNQLLLVFSRWKNRKGYIPVREDGAEIFRGVRGIGRLFALSEEQSSQHQRWMIRVLATKEPLSAIGKGSEKMRLADPN